MTDGLLPVLLTGSVPRRPASEVFAIAGRYLGHALRRVPDGEQNGWTVAAWATFAENPVLEPGRLVPMTDAGSPFHDMRAQYYRLRDGRRAEELRLEPFGVAATALDSYRQLQEHTQHGRFRPGIRFQVTIPSPATIGGPLELPHDVVLPAVEAAMLAEVREVARSIPAQELAIQFDLAAELELEEARRRPDAFDAPFCDVINETWGAWTAETLAASVARVADAVPAEAELGFHLCGLWHIDPRGGQDMRVHRDFANLLAERVHRPISYVHVASIPEHGAADYAVLSELRLSPDTELYLGLIHRGDGVAGARRRIEAARTVRDGFGVAHFCGLGPMFGVTPDRLDEVLELHREVAEL